MDPQEQNIALFVRKTDALRRSQEQHWRDAVNAIETGRLSQAISLLNAYFYQEEELIQAEGQLKGILKGYFADR